MSLNPIYLGNQCTDTVTDDATWSTTDSLTTASGVCNPGYVGSPTRDCLPDGTWPTAINGAYCSRRKSKLFLTEKISLFHNFFDHSVPKTSCQKDLVKGMGLRCPKGDFKVGAFESKPGGVGGVVLS